MRILRLSRLKPGISGVLRVGASVPCALVRRLQAGTMLRMHQLDASGVQL